MNKGLRVRVYQQGNDSTVEHTFYVGVSGQTSSLANIPDLASPEPDPYAGTLRSQNVRIDIASEAIVGDLGDASDRIDWTGRKVDASETTDDGSSYTVEWTGRVTIGPSEMDGPGKQTLIAQGENWVNRGERLFTTAGGTTMLYPAGLTTDWGPFTANATPTWRVYEVEDTNRLRIGIWPSTVDGELALSREHADYLINDLKAVPRLNRNDGLGNFEFLRFRDTTGAQDLEIISLGASMDQSFGNLTGDLEEEDPVILSIWVYWASHGKSVGEEVNGYIRAADAEPSPVNKRHIDVTDFGVFLEDALDGTYGGNAAVLDTTTTFAAYNASTNPYGLKSNPYLPLVFARIESTHDRTDWLAKHVLGPTQVGLFENADGEIAPRQWRNPVDVDPATLTTLDASNSRIRSYDVRGNEAITVIAVEAEHTYRYQGETADQPSDLIASRKHNGAELEQTHDNVSALGRRVRTYDITAFLQNRSFPLGLAREIAGEVFARVGDGPAWYEVETHDSTLLPGTFCVLDLDTLKAPNPATNARTGDRIVQIATRTVKDGGAHYLLECQDLGPSAAVLSAPTVTVTATSQHTVDIAISGLGTGEGYRLSVDTDNDGTYEVVQKGDGNETVEIGDLPAGTQVTAFANATKEGRIRSAASTTASDTTTALSAPTGLSVSVDETEATGTWTNNETVYEIEVLLDGSRVAVLPPGTSQYTLRGLVASQAYNSPGFEVRYIDDYGGTSALATATFTAGIEKVAPAMAGFELELTAFVIGGQTFVAGVAVHLYPGDPAFDIEIQRAPDSAGSPGTWATRNTVSGSLATYFDHVPEDGGTYWYRVRHIRSGYTDGAWATAQSIAVTDADGRSEEGERKPGTIRALTGEFDVDTDNIFADTNKLKNTVSIKDTSASFTPVRHLEADTAIDGEGVSFSQNYEGIPSISFVPQIGKVFDSATLGTAADQFLNLKASSPSVSGFTAKFELQQGNTTSPITDGFSSTINASAPENGDVSLSADGDVAYSNLEDANTTETTYKAYFDVDTTGMDSLNLVTVELYYSADDSPGGTTTWTLGDSTSYNSGSTWSDQVLSVTTALGTNFDLRLRISYSSAPGSSTATVTAHGEDNTQPGVEFDKVTASGTSVPVASSEDEAVLWLAQEDN